LKSDRSQTGPRPCRPATQSTEQPPKCVSWPTPTRMRLSPNTMVFLARRRVGPSLPSRRRNVDAVCALTRGACFTAAPQNKALREGIQWNLVALRGPSHEGEIWQMTNDKSRFVVRTSDRYLSLVIGHFLRGGAGEGWRKARRECACQRQQNWQCLHRRSQ